jgi:hypothetical protein
MVDSTRLDSMIQWEDSTRLDSMIQWEDSTGLDSTQLYGRQDSMIRQTRLDDTVGRLDSTQ